MAKITGIKFKTDIVVNIALILLRKQMFSQRFNGIQSYTCLNPMIMVKLTSKVQKNMFERVKNGEKILEACPRTP